MTLPTRLGTAAAAKYLGVSRRQLGRLVEQGLIRAADMRTDGALYAKWTFHTDDLDNFINSRTVGAA